MDNNKEKSKTNKGVLVLLIIVIMALGVFLVILYTKLNDQKKENDDQKKESAQVQEFLEEQKQKLHDELVDLHEDFGKLETTNDSLKTLASSQQEHITKLLAERGNYIYEIRRYQKELETLRGVLVDLYYRVDSLNQLNIALTRDKEALNKNLDAERRETRRLTEEREQLTTTVQRARVLSVSDIKTIGLNNKGSETPRVRNIDKLQTSFTIRENPSAEPGERIFYLVIIKPDRTSLSNRSNAFFETHDGNHINYADKRTIDYNNVDIEARIFCDNNGRLTAGRYDLRIYCEGYLVGSSSFELR